MRDRPEGFLAHYWREALASLRPSLDGSDGEVAANVSPTSDRRYSQAQPSDGDSNPTTRRIAAFMSVSSRD